MRVQIQADTLIWHVHHIWAFSRLSGGSGDRAVCVCHNPFQFTGRFCFPDTLPCTKQIIFLFRYPVPRFGPWRDPVSVVRRAEREKQASPSSVPRRGRERKSFARSWPKLLWSACVARARALKRVQWYRRKWSTMRMRRQLTATLRSQNKCGIHWRLFCEDRINVASIGGHLAKPDWMRIVDSWEIVAKTTGENIFIPRWRFFSSTIRSSHHRGSFQIIIIMEKKPPDCKIKLKLVQT